MAKEKTSDKPAPRLSWGWLAVAWVIFAFAVFASRDFLAMYVGYAKMMEGMTPGARFFRDFMVGLSALTGIAIAAWRTSALDRQSITAAENARTAAEQAKTATGQFKLAESRLLNDQFAVAAGLVEKETAGEKPKPAITARINGIRIMAGLAMKKPEEFAEQVVINLISYIKNNIQETARPRSGSDNLRLLGEDVKAAFVALHQILDGNKMPQISGDILDFSHQDFSRLVLDDSQVHLEHYNKWVETDFQGAQLNSAVFNEGAVLRGANLRDASLQRAKLNRAILHKSTMTGADLCEAEMMEAALHDADLRGAALTGAHLQGARMTHAKMMGCDLAFARLERAEGGERTLLLGADLRGATLEKTELEDAVLRGANLRGTVLRANLQGADLEHAQFGATYMYDADIDFGALPEDVKKAMNGAIWYPQQKHVPEIREQADLRLWQLMDKYAFMGFLRHFAEYPRLDGIDATFLRLQIWEQYAKKSLPEELSEGWVEWIKNIDPETGEHPTDNPF